MDLDGLAYALHPMAVGDIPTVAAIENIVFTLPWSPSSFRYEVKNNSSSVYLVLRYGPWSCSHTSPLLRPVRRLLRPGRQDSSLLGYAGFWMMVDEAHICTLALRAEWRGRGLGELLLASLIDKAMEYPVQMVTLEVRVSNTVAQSLYRKYGFQIVGRRKRYYSDNGEDAYIMSTDSIRSDDYLAHLGALSRGLRERILASTQTAPSRV